MKGSWGFKLLAVAGVMVVVSLVLLRIDWLVQERRGRQLEAVRSVEQSHAGAQALLGPLLWRQCTEAWDTEVGEGKARRTEVQTREFGVGAVPATLQVASQTTHDPRYRGLFKVNTYAGQHVLQAHWPELLALQPRPTQPKGRVSCLPAVLMVAVSDVRGIRRATVQLDGQDTAVHSGTPHPQHPRGLQARLAEGRAWGEPLAARITLDLVGTAHLALVPAAGDTQWTLRADWPHPSFGGRFLPRERSVDEAGFRAEWAVSALASAAGADVLRGAALCSGAVDDDAYAQAGPGTARGGDKARPGCLDLLAVAYIDPVNPYVLTDRATKYALLFVTLTFLAVGLVELLSGRRVHPVQYALVGLALAVFYLLLLALSEHLAFDTAYRVAATACAGLLGWYAAHMLGRRRAGLAFGAGMAGLYAMLWVLLQREQTALVVGAVGLFAALAAVMAATRRLDWYRLAGPAPGAAPSVAACPSPSSPG